jgi:hypothetical protein
MIYVAGSPKLLWGGVVLVDLLARPALSNANAAARQRPLGLAAQFGTPITQSVFAKMVTAR